jgi:tRNA(adenine34) deaminase
MVALMKNQDLDIYWMKKALLLGEKAVQKDEVPVGAIIINTSSNQIVSKAFNLRETLKSPIAHAEILAIHRAATKLQTWRLSGHTLYVTLEPCVMCTGAILQSRIDRIVFGALDPKGGAVKSLFQILNDSRLNHQALYTGLVLGEDCSDLLKTFFKKLRNRKKEK